MFVLRVVIEYALALLFRLVTFATLMQGLSALLAAGVAFAIAGGSGAPAWLSFALVRIGVLSAILVVGGIVLGVLQMRAAKQDEAAPASTTDDSLPREWVLPALVPTLLLPAFASWLSRDLVVLWKDAVLLLDRLGLREEFARGGNFAGLAFMPIFAALVVPALEAVAGVLLVAIPPLLLALLVARSQRFRTSCQLLLAAQASFVLASLAGADVFSRIFERMLPHLRTMGGPEEAQIIAGLTRARDVLTSTSIGYGAVLAAYGLSLWWMMTARGASAIEPAAAPLPDERGGGEAMELPAAPRPVRASPPAPAPRSERYDRVDELPAASRREVEDAIARYRAKRDAMPDDPGLERSGSE